MNSQVHHPAFMIPNYQPLLVGMEIIGVCHRKNFDSYIFKTKENETKILHVHKTCSRCIDRCECLHLLPFIRYEDYTCKSLGCSCLFDDMHLPCHDGFRQFGVLSCPIYCCTCFLCREKFKIQKMKQGDEAFLGCPHDKLVTVTAGIIAL